MATAITPFGQWVNLTREKPKGDLNKLFNDAVRNTYFFSRLIKGMGEKILQTGTQITEKIKLYNQGNGRSYRPGEPANLNRVTTNRSISVPPRFQRTHIHWTDAEKQLQGDDHVTVFTKFKKSCEQELETDCWEMVETSLWLQPDATKMENVSDDETGDPYSILAFITENTTGGGAYMAPGWQANAGTIETLSPTAETRWRNYQKSYNPNDPYGDSGIFTGMDDMMISLKFDAPQGAKDYYERDDLQKMFIVTNKAGRTLFQNGLRQGNDHFRGSSNAQDPAYGSPVFNGYPIYYVSALDTVALEETGGTYTGTPWLNPRYLFINGNFLHPIMMNKSNGSPFDDVGPLQVSGLQADTDIWYRRIWWNLFCESRQRQGILHPVAA